MASENVQYDDYDDVSQSHESCGKSGDPVSEGDECQILPTLPLHLRSHVNTHYTCEEFMNKLWQRTF